MSDKAGRGGGRENAGRAEQITRDSVSFLITALLCAVLWLVRYGFAVGRGLIAALASCDANARNGTQPCRYSNSSSLNC